MSGAGSPPRRRFARQYRQNRSPALSPRPFSPYISGAGLPAMAINGRRNKPFGPGGGTRRLHHSGIRGQ
jgi:hypothetical protein